MNLQRAINVLERVGYGKVGVEVGVKNGTFSRKLLLADRNLRLFLVDWWQEAPKDSAYRRTGDKSALASYEKHERSFQAMLDNVRPFWNRVCILRMPSSRAPAFLPKIDWAYLDADHSEEGCGADIDTYAPLCEEVAGHDWTAPEKAGNFGVQPAVRKRFREFTTAGAQWFAHAKDYVAP